MELSRFISALYKVFTDAELTAARYAAGQAREHKDEIDIPVPVYHAEEVQVELSADLDVESLKDESVQILLSQASSPEFTDSPARERDDDGDALKERRSMRPSRCHAKMTFTVRISDYMEPGEG